MFSPTNDVNGDYVGIIPRAATIPNVTSGALEKIFKGQEKRAKIYTLVSDPEVIRPIFEQLRNIPECSAEYFRISRTIETIGREAQARISIVESDNSLQYGDRKEKIQKIRSMAVERARDLYKGVLSKYQETLLKIPEITRNKAWEKIILYININPRLLLVFDDCITELNAIMKKSAQGQESILDKIFARGRWAYMTIIIGAQDDSLVKTLIRKNTYVSIFTDAESANHFMENKANSVAKNKRIRAKHACDAVFESSQSKHKKLVYYRGGTPEIWSTYTIAEDYGKFRVGSPDYWVICEMISKKSGECRNDVLFE
jgi:hypothetical protein